MSQPFNAWKQLRNLLRRVACATVLLAPLLAQAETIGVLYPETREPYRQVYANIIDGIGAEYRQDIKQFAIAEDASVESVQQWLNDDGVTALVVLGSQSLTYLPADNTRPMVVGGTILKPQPKPRPGITLNPAPSSLFSGLLKLKPRVSEIHVVYEAAYNSWVITEAEKAADNLGLKLHRHPVSGMREAAATYREVQKRLKSEKAALWLPLGGPSREKSILQSILQTAWSRDQIVISSNLADVRRGALYALYPDNRAMGAELARLLKVQSEDTTSEAKTLFLSSTLQAVNLRTAEHIGLRLAKDDLRKFSFVYPPQ